MALKLDMSTDVFQKATEGSAQSGEAILADIRALKSEVEKLRETFKGDGAVAFHNFMVECDNCANQVSDALASINVGQAEMGKAYNASTETMTADAQKETSAAQSFPGFSK